MPVGAPLVTFEVETAGGETAPQRVGDHPRRGGDPRGQEAGEGSRHRPLGRLGHRTGRADHRRGPATRRVVCVERRRGRGRSSPVRREIARRLTEVAAIPQVTTFRTVDCTALDGFRRELDVSPLPVFVAALARICGDHPLLNAAWMDGRDPRVPFGACRGRDGHRERVDGAGVDERPCHGHRGHRRRRSSGWPRPRAAGTCSRRPPTGATISVSNTGSYGSEAGTPLLNPGNAVTVALGVIQPRALVVEGEVVARPACTLSLTFDHRVLDGAAVGRALTDLVDLLQDPARLRDLPR